MTYRRGGFTFLELLIVVLVLGILSSMAVLRYIDLKHRALSSRVTADMTAIRFAAYNAMYNNGDWPPETSAGVVPPELAPHLGAGFTFSRPEYTLDWENLGGGGGSIQVGVTVTTTNARLMNTLIHTIGNRGPFMAVGDQVTLVIVGPNGES